MDRNEFDALPTFGGSDPWPKPIGFIIIRVRFCFQRCLKCGMDIAGYEAVVFRDRGEALYQCQKAYHLGCIVDL